MPDLKEGESIQVQGSSLAFYTLKNVGGVYSCSCPSWRNQSAPIDRRSCKHLRIFRSEQAERQRVGNLSPKQPSKNSESKPAAALLLAQTWKPSHDPTGWHLSEKLDGVRAWWTGERILSRNGNVFHAPPWFLDQLPSVPLDGELWLGRGAFQRTVSIVRRQDAGVQWRELNFVVFDAPTVAGNFESRSAYLRDLFLDRRPSHAWLLDQTRCQGRRHLELEMERIAALGGEGLMLRQSGSPYEPGRSPTLLKVKSFHDAEATVLAHIPGRGRHKGRLGALRAALADGTEFSVGSGFSDAQRASPPPVGSRITFRYQELRGYPERIIEKIAV